MRKKQAIKVLQSQIDKIEELESPVKFDKSWLVQTRSYIKYIFGLKSHEYSWIIRLRVGCNYSDNPLPHLYNCLETIKNKGVYKEPKSNFFILLPDWAAGFLLAIILTIGIAIGESKVISKTIYKIDVNDSIIKKDTIPTPLLDTSYIHPSSQPTPKKKNKY